jgi:predicted transcriptional regulator
LKGDSIATKKIPLIIYLDAELAEWLQRMHDEEGYPKSALVRLALRDFKVKRETKEG